MSRRTEIGEDGWPEYYTRAEFQGTPLAEVERVARADINENQHPSYSHCHSGSVELTYLYRGKQNYMVGEKDYQLYAGDMFITYPDEIHSTGGLPEERSVLYFMIFRLTPETESLLGLSPEDTRWIRETLWSCRQRVFRGSPEVPKLMQRVLDLYRADDPMKESRIRSVLWELLYQICRCILGDTARRVDLPPEFSALLEEIEKNLDRSYSVSEMADMVLLSESHFKRKFKEYLGFSPNDYMMRRKLARAEELLRDPEMTVTEVAVNLNFSSSQHFSTTFRKYTGLTPTEYRKNL